MAIGRNFGMGMFLGGDPPKPADNAIVAPILAPLVISASGTVGVNGTGAPILAPLVISGSGTVGVNGTGAPLLAPLVVSASGSYFDPTTPSGLFAWYRSDLGISTTSGLVNSWGDQSGNGHNVSNIGSLRPTYSSSGGPNNVPYVLFDTSGGLQRLQATITSISQPFEYYMVLQPTVANPAVTAEIVDFGGNKSLTYTPASTSNWAQFNGSGPVNATAYTAGTDTIVQSLFNGASSLIALNNGTPTSGGNPGTAATGTTLTIGNNNNGSFEARVRIYEICIYTTPLSTGNKQSLTRYMGTRYSITVP